MCVRITWLGHASVMIAYDAQTVYIDPWKLSPTLPTADIILITHDHFDHFSAPDIEQLSQEHTRIIAPFNHPLMTDRMSPFETLAIGEVMVETLPAYNISTDYHPRDNNWVGYIVTVAGKRIYHPGDTDRIPEMQGIKADVVLLPVGGTFTMDAAAACEAAFDIGPKHIIPIHYGDIVGTRQDALTLRARCSLAVDILNPGESLSLE